MLFQEKASYHSCLYNFSPKSGVCLISMFSNIRKKEKGVRLWFKWGQPWFLSCHHWRWIPVSFLPTVPFLLSKQTQPSGTMMYCSWNFGILLLDVFAHGTATRAKHGQRHTKHLHALQPQALESCNDSFVRILLLISNTLPCIRHPGYDATKVQFAKKMNKQQKVV